MDCEGGRAAPPRQGGPPLALRGLSRHVGLCTPRRPYERYGFDSRGGFKGLCRRFEWNGDPRCCSGPCKSIKGLTQTTLTLPPPYRVTEPNPCRARQGESQGCQLAARSLVLPKDEGQLLCLSPRLGSILRRGGAPPSFGRAIVLTPAGGLTARPTAVGAQICSGFADGRTPAPIKGDPSTPPLDKGRPRGADAGCKWKRSGQEMALLVRSRPAGYMA